jgi:hypothetical protein
MQTSPVAAALGGRSVGDCRELAAVDHFQDGLRVLPQAEAELTTNLPEHTGYGPNGAPTRRCF